MATTIERMGTTVEAILGHQVDTSLLLRVAHHFANHGGWRAEFDGLVEDPENPTNGEFAGFFLLKMKVFGQDVLRAEGRRQAGEDAAAAIAAAGEAAAADMAE